MPGTATITGIVGPAQAVTASVFNNLSWFALDTANEVLDLIYNNGSGNIRTQISVAAATTWTLTVSGNTYTLTVS
jgi:hypothetical protein